ncbi:hypothetical protein F4776DRAFT_646365 [Hypoxylon sp. NC0597]|nr:hypothetical protein F4776DRAFT_646365 [Hypoxylon sp. NC0597]
MIRSETSHRVQDDIIKGIPFEQAGVPDIRRLRANTALACSFQTLLMVQPAITPRTYSWMEKSQSSTDYRADATYAINMICRMEGGELKVITLYDPNVVKDGEMQRILSDFSHILHKLYRSSDGLIRVILIFFQFEILVSAEDAVEQTTLDVWICCRVF